MNLFGTELNTKPMFSPTVFSVFLFVLLAIVRLKRFHRLTLGFKLTVPPLSLSGGAMLPHGIRGVSGMKEGSQLDLQMMLRNTPSSRKVAQNVEFPHKFFFQGPKKKLQGDLRTFTELNFWLFSSSEECDRRDRLAYWLLTNLNWKLVHNHMEN